MTLSWPLRLNPFSAPNNRQDQGATFTKFCSSITLINYWTEEIINNKKFPSNTTSLLWLEWQHVSTLLGHHQAFTIRLLNTELFILVFVNNVWDPKDARSFIIGWFIVKTWWWPSRVETCCHSNHNKLVVFDRIFLLLIISNDNTSGWFP